MGPLIVSILLAAMFQPTVVHQATGFEIRYKVCTTEELRKSVEQVCIRLAARGENSNLAISPYGVPMSMDSQPQAGTDGMALDQATLTEADLLEILKFSRPYHRGRRVNMSPQPLRPKMIFKRGTETSELCEYLETCCNRSCVIDPKHLNLYCTAKK